MARKPDPIQPPSDLALLETRSSEVRDTIALVLLPAYDSVIGATVALAGTVRRGQPSAALDGDQNGDGSGA